MVIGENSRPGDMDVNATKEKKLTNIRTHAHDEALRLTPPRPLTLESAIEFIAADELVEVTPASIRIRKRILSQHDRRRERGKEFDLRQAADRDGVSPAHGTQHDDARTPSRASAHRARRGSPAGGGSRQRFEVSRPLSSSQQAIGMAPVVCGELRPELGAVVRVLAVRVDRLELRGEGHQDVVRRVVDR